jgi:general stress protein YciG
MAKSPKGDMSVRDAGRKGGEKGGQTTKERYGTPFYREIGRKGGETVRAERGHEFYEEIGKKGGQRVRDLIAAAKASATETEEGDGEK